MTSVAKKTMIRIWLLWKKIRGWKHVGMEVCKKQVCNKVGMQHETCGQKGKGNQERKGSLSVAIQRWHDRESSHGKEILQTNVIQSSILAASIVISPFFSTVKRRHKEMKGSILSFSSSLSLSCEISSLFRNYKNSMYKNSTTILECMFKAILNINNMTKFILQHHSWFSLDFQVRISRIPVLLANLFEGLCSASQSILGFVFY